MPIRKSKAIRFTSTTFNAIDCWPHQHLAFWVILFCSLAPSRFIAQISDSDPIIYLEQYEKNKISWYLNIIEDQTGLVFSYSTNLVDLETVVELDQLEIRLSELLNQLFRGQKIKPLRKGERKIVLAPARNPIFGHPGKISYQRISGTVRDLESGEVLIGAYVSDAGSQFVTTTNDIGRFHVILPADVKSLFISYVGYETFLCRVPPSSTKSRDIRMRRNSAIDEVVISGLTGEQYLANKSQNHFFQSESLIRDLQLVGQLDPVHSLSQLPSVQSGHEAHHGLMVRGGSQDQNLILVDGVPLYESSHVLGFASFINADAIKNIQLFKQAFPSKYGGKLSSVIDFQLKEGNRYRHEFSGGINTFNTHLHSNGPIVRDQTSYSVSLRKSNIDLIFSDLIEKFLDKESTSFKYYDVNAKIHHSINDQNSLSFSVLKAQDKVRFQDREVIAEGLSELTIGNTDQFDWGTTFFSLKWTSILSSHLSAKFYAYTSDYHYQTRSAFQFQLNDYNLNHRSDLDVMAFSRIRDNGLKSEFSLFYNNQIKFEFGAGFIRHQFNPSLRQSQEPLEESEELPEEIPGSTVNSNELSSYAEMQYAFGEGHSITFGSRLNSINVNDKRYVSLEPRLNIDFRLNSTSRFSASYTGMTQFTHLLVNSGIGLPSELYIPSTENLPPEKSRQLTISFTQELPQSIELSLSGYYKKMNNVLEYKYPHDLFHTFVNDPDADNLYQGTIDWYSRVSVGSSLAKGVEISLSKKESAVNWGISYSLSKTDRQFEDLNDGKAFPYRFDRRHDLRLYSGIEIFKDFSFQGQWVYGTGQAFSLAIEQYLTYDGEVILHSDGINNFRFKPYHRLDLFLNYSYQFSSGNVLRLEGGVRNAYNRSNTYYVYLFENPINNDYELRQINILPVLPQFNAYFTF